MKLQRLLLAFHLSAAVIVGPPASSSAAVAPENGVRLHTETCYSGRTLLFSPDRTHSVILQPTDRNQISSIEVPVGFKVTLIDRDEEEPRSQTFKAGKHCFVGEQMNNKTDAVVILRDDS